MAVLKRTTTVVLHFPTLAHDSLQLACATDGSVTNRAEKSNLIGFVTRADDKNGAMRVVSFRSCKAWRLCRSAMALETFAFVEGFDSTLALGSQLSQMLAKDVKRSCSFMPSLFFSESGEHKFDQVSEYYK
jgi:hypothetical protein